MQSTGRRETVRSNVMRTM